MAGGTLPEAHQLNPAKHAGGEQAVGSLHRSKVAQARGRCSNIRMSIPAPDTAFSTTALNAWEQAMHDVAGGYGRATADRRSRGSMLTTVHDCVLVIGSLLVACSV